MVVIAILLNALLLVLMIIGVITDFANNTEEVTIILAVVVPIFNIFTFVIKKPVGFKWLRLYFERKRLEEQQKIDALSKKNEQK